MPLSLAQDSVAKNPARFRVVVAGRRFGKTHLSIRELCYHAKDPGKDVWYVAPTYKMARQIVWRKLKNKLQDLNWVTKTNETELTITLVNGSGLSITLLQQLKLVCANEKTAVVDVCYLHF